MSGLGDSRDGNLLDLRPHLREEIRELDVRREKLGAVGGGEEGVVALQHLQLLGGAGGQRRSTRELKREN